MQIGDVIASIRRKKRIDQQELAKKLKKSIGYISQIENGHRKPSIKLLKAIATELDVPLSAILFQLVEGRHFSSSKGRELFKSAKPIMDDLIDLFTESKVRKVVKKKSGINSKKISD
jgi:transcriptional regulator with XRE-family HTH domain